MTYVPGTTIFFEMSSIPPSIATHSALSIGATNCREDDYLGGK